MQCQIYKASFFAWDNNSHQTNKKGYHYWNFFKSTFNEPFLSVFLSAHLNQRIGISNSGLLYANIETLWHSQMNSDHPQTWVSREPGQTVKYSFNSSCMFLCSCPASLIPYRWEWQGEFQSENAMNVTMYM